MIKQIRLLIYSALTLLLFSTTAKAQTPEEFSYYFDYDIGFIVRPDSILSSEYFKKFADDDGNRYAAYLTKLISLFNNSNPEKTEYISLFVQRAENLLLVDQFKTRTLIALKSSPGYKIDSLFTTLASISDESIGDFKIDVTDDDLQALSCVGSTDTQLIIGNGFHVYSIARFISLYSPSVLGFVGSEFKEVNDGYGLPDIGFVTRDLNFSEKTLELLSSRGDFTPDNPLNDYYLNSDLYGIYIYFTDVVTIRLFNQCSSHEEAESFILDLKVQFENNNNNVSEEDQQMILEHIINNLSPDEFIDLSNFKYDLDYATHGNLAAITITIDKDSNVFILIKVFEKIILSYFEKQTQEIAIPDSQTPMPEPSANKAEETTKINRAFNFSYWAIESNDYTELQKYGYNLPGPVTLQHMSEQMKDMIYTVDQIQINGNRASGQAKFEGYGSKHGIEYSKPVVFVKTDSWKMDIGFTTDQRDIAENYYELASAFKSGDYATVKEMLGDNAPPEDQFKMMAGFMNDITFEIKDIKVDGDTGSAIVQMKGTVMGQEVNETQATSFKKIAGKWKMDDMDPK